MTTTTRRPWGWLQCFVRILRWNLWWRGPLHRFYRWYLRESCGGSHHVGPYGPDGRYIVLMTEQQYHEYSHGQTPPTEAQQHALRAARQRIINRCEAVQRFPTELQGSLEGLQEARRMIGALFDELPIDDANDIHQTPAAAGVDPKQRTIGGLSA